MEPVNKQAKEEKNHHHRQKSFYKVFMLCTIDPFRKASLRASQTSTSY